MFKPSTEKRSFTEGSIFPKIILFALPIMMTSILQVLYNMADHIVVGRFSGDPLALAAVGSTASMTALVVNTLVGISAGTSVLVAQSYGAKNHSMISRITHTSITFAALGGIAFCAIGFLVSRPALIAMGTKAELLDNAVLYMRIICAGIPASAVMNFGAAVLRSTGDSKTPMVVFSLSGLLNVLLNLLFVIKFGMSVDGVSLATIISQYAAAVAILTILKVRKNESYALKFRQLRIDPQILVRVLRYGVPAAIQGIMYSISNIVITGAGNVFSTVDISAKTIMGNVDSVVYNVLNSFLHASMTITAQNYGAGKHERLGKVLRYSVIQSAAIGIILGQILLLVSRPLMSLFIEVGDPNAELILEKGSVLLNIMLNTYFLCGLQEVLSGVLRGLGYSILPMMISIGGICGTRILWVCTVFNLPALHTMPGLFTVYPVSWMIASVILTVACAIAFRKLKRIHLKKSDEAEKKTATV